MLRRYVRTKQSCRSHNALLPLESAGNTFIAFCESAAVEPYYYRDVFVGCIIRNIQRASLHTFAIGNIMFDIIVLGKGLKWKGGRRQD